MAVLDKITPHRLRIPPYKNCGLSFGAVKKYENLAAEVEVIDCDGHSGLVEAFISAGYTDETIADSWHAAREFAMRIAHSQSADDAPRIDL